MQRAALLFTGPTGMAWIAGRWFCTPPPAHGHIAPAVLLVPCRRLATLISLVGAWKFLRIGFDVLCPELLHHFFDFMRAILVTAL